MSRDLSPSTGALLPLLDHPVRLQAAIQACGWALLALEVDLSREHVRLQVRRPDGLLVTFDGRAGKSSTTRERMRLESTRIGRRGDIARVDRACLEFLGRTRHAGFGEGLRWFSDYLVDNALSPVLEGAQAPLALEHVA